MASFSIVIDVALRFLDEPPLRGGIRNFSFTMPVAASRSSVSPSESSSNDDMSTFEVCLGCGPANAAAHLQGQRKPWSMSTPPPTTPKVEKTGEHMFLGKWSNRLWAVGSDVPRVPRLCTTAHCRYWQSCRLTRLVSCEMWRQLPWPRLVWRCSLAWRRRRRRGSVECFG
jgi:hypothetical protein